jgi:phosphoglycolate phosphatase-like HAD superfamily hydrolase
MANVQINGRVFSPKLIAFDKDGTLIDFHHIWGQKTRRWVEAMVQAAGGNEAMRTALYGTLGFDIEQNRVVPDGPVAVATNPKIYNVAAAVLYQQGLGWHQAEALAQESGRNIFGAMPTADLIRPIGAVAATIKQLAGADIRIATITSDDRSATEQTLALLGISVEVAILACGNDDMPSKPDPAGLRHIGQQLGVATADMLMVGDTVSDMLFGRNAGVAGCIAVVGGAGDEAALRETADTLISSIEAIQLL